MVGAGVHMTQTVGLALATDLVPEEQQPNVVGLMYVMLLLGTIVSALIFGMLLSDFTPAKLVQVIQGAAVATMALNLLALWKQESRHRGKAMQRAPEMSFQQAWASFRQGQHAVRRLLALGLGTTAFTMQDVLLEPYGGQVLQLTVASTTRLTATLALGGLLGFGLASKVLSRGADPFRMASYGALVGVPAFLCVIFAAPLDLPWLFALGALLIGFGGGLFSHGTLTATMKFAPPNQVGLALGAWGAVQATAAGLAVATGGVLRDIMAGLASAASMGPATGYIMVYALEATLMLVTLVIMAPLVRKRVPG
jgi:BCD family chlorophyll transporter-like MFS transporter